jgi:hypothetical protein
MNFGLFEIALLLGSVTTGVAGARAAAARRRSAPLLTLNAVFAVGFAYFAVQGLRVGGIVAAGLSLLACANVAVASAIVSRAAPKAPAA